MRETFCQALGRTVITCTIDTTTLIMWERQRAAFRGRQNHFVSPQTQPESSTRWFFSVPAFLFIIFWCVYSLCDVSTSSWLREGLVMTKENLFLHLGDRLSPFSSRWPCTDLYNWYYNVDHVWLAPLGVDKTILSPPKRSLSPTRGDSSLSQLFLFIIFWCVYSLCDVSCVWG